MTSLQMNHWMFTTLQFAGVCGGADEKSLDQISCRVRETVGHLRQHSPRAVAVAILERAVELVGPDWQSPNFEIQPEHHAAVIRWTLTTLQMVRYATGKPAVAQEWLEAEADRWIVGPIQGNRGGRPSRHDLDRIVRRTVQRGLDDISTCALSFFINLRTNTAAVTENRTDRA